MENICRRGIRIGELVYKFTDSNKSQISNDAEYTTKFLENLSMTETSRNKHKRDMCFAGLATFPTCHRITIRRVHNLHNLSETQFPFLSNPWPNQCEFGGIFKNLSDTKVFRSRLQGESSIMYESPVCCPGPMFVIFDIFYTGHSRILNFK
jgi:hypothetical protein